MKKNIQLLCSFLFISINLCAQDLYYSHYQAVPSLANPAMLRPDSNFAVQLYHRNQPVFAGQRFTTSNFSLAYPLFRKHGSAPWSTLGLSIIDHHQPNSINSRGALLAWAYHLRMPQSVLTFAMQGGVMQTGLLLTDITTRSQYVAGTGFDPDLPTQENLGNLQKIYGVLSAGLHWSVFNENGREKHFLGVGMMNMNRPRIDFPGQTEEDNVFRLSPNLIMSGGLEIYRQNRFYIQPNLRAIYRQEKLSYQLGSWLGYEFLPDLFSRPIKEGYFQLGVWYFSNQSLITAISLNQLRYQFTFTYDVPVSQKSEIWLGSGAFELGLTLKFSTRKKSAAIPDWGITSLSSQPFRPHPIGQLAEPSIALIEKDTFSVGEITLIFEPFYIKLDENKKITEHSLLKLEAFTDYWRHYPDTKILVNGFCYNQGSEDQNLKTSGDIAEIVKEVMVQTGVDAEKIYTLGMGAQKVTIIGDTEIGNSNYLIRISPHMNDE